MPIKYYLYISDSKVDMLYSQIPRAFLSGLSGELKLNLGLLSTTFKQEASPETRFAKLDAVIEYLAAEEDIGSVDKPSAYFKGTLEMNWGPYGSVDSPLVYFGGQTPHTILGLGGSSHHVVGGQRGASSPSSHSATYFMMDRIAAELDIPNPYRQHPPDRGEGDHSSMVVRAVELATQQMQGPKENMEFFARRLLFSQKGDENHWGTDMNVLLGSPLYVAQL